MKVLSLFDGISCGLVALKRAGIPVSRYVAYEIDKYAKIVSLFNHPEIEQRGNVEGSDWREFIGFDMVIGGFPCTNLSIAGNREGLKGKESSLFWEQVTAIEIIKPKFFLVENNYGMPKDAERIITEALGVEPILINSALVSAQQRRRLYWTNIPNLEQPEDKGILLKDIIESGSTPRIKGLALTANYYKKNVRDCLIKSRGTAIFEPVRIGAIGKGGQANRVYSIEGKSVCLNANGGGQGARTGLYAILQLPRGYNLGGLKEDKAPTITKRSYQHNNLLVKGAALRTRDTDQGRVKRPEVRTDEKSNALTSVQSDSLVIYNTDDENVHQVIDGVLFYKQYTFKVKLPDGYYAIRKLTPVECERLQTLPDHYTELVSDTQRYKCLGNGWTVDVIAHIFRQILLNEIM